MINQLFFKSDYPDHYQDELVQKIKLEQAHHGHYALPEQDLSFINDYRTKIERVQNPLDSIVVIGIGGSSLGAQAVYEFLKGTQNFRRSLYFLDSTNPLDIDNICQKIVLANTHFIVVSKSGTTIEVITLYKYLQHLVKKANISHSAFSFISEKSSPLITHAKAIKAPYLLIDKNISGRFSLLSAVGLAPLVLVGVDIKKLLAGAKALKTSFFHPSHIQDILLKKAYFYAKNSPHININALFSYGQSLCFFNHWFVQLWAESLGKKQHRSGINVGLTPIGLIGPKDQHSFLQLLAQGKHDKSVTFIKLTNKHKKSIPKSSLVGLEAFDTLNNLSFSALINKQADATIATLQSYGDIPIDVIELEGQDEYSIGELAYYYELLTALVGILLDVNTYDQPGVELTKQILRQKLQR